MTEQPELLTIEEAARYLNVSKISLRRWTNDGQLRCFRVGVRSERRFLETDLRDFLERQAARPRSTFGAGPAAADGARWQDGHHRSADNHVSLHFSNPDEQFRVLRPYLIKHLRLSAPILYINDSTPRARLMNLLRAEGLDSGQPGRHGALRVIPSHQAYLHNGTFSADRTLAFIENAIREMLSQARAALVTGEMSWFFEPGAKGVGGIVDYERRINLLAAKYPTATMVCQYSIEKFDSAMTLEMLCVHPVVELPDRTVPGFYQARC